MTQTKLPPKNPARFIDLKTGLQSIANYDTSVGALLHKHDGLHYSLGLSRAQFC